LVSGTRVFGPRNGIPALRIVTESAASQLFRHVRAAWKVDEVESGGGNSGSVPDEARLDGTVCSCGVSRLTFQTAELGKDNKPAFEPVTTVGARSPCFLR
jgi:hypothetical protein